MKNNFNKKIISILLIGSMVLLLGMTVSASANERMNVCNKELTRYFKKDGYSFTTAIENLVDNKELSRKKADLILEYAKEKREEFKNMSKEEKIKLMKTKKYGLLKELEAKGIITAKESQKIRSEVIRLKKERFDNALDSLVEKEIVTSEQLLEMKKYFEEYKEDRIKEYNKLKYMSSKERKEYIKELKKNRKNPLDEMVDKKIITKVQRDKIKEELRNMYKDNNKSKKRVKKFLMFRKR